jgi:hypothetical protein
VTYDLLAVVAILSVPAVVILLLVVRTQGKEIERLRQQVTYVKRTRQQLALSDAENPTSEQEALEFDGTRTDHLEAEPPRKAGYDSSATSVFEKLRLRR